jgi:hypothetical protein
MTLKILSLVLLVSLILASDKAKIRVLNEKNLEQFAKDNSYWFIQISSKSRLKLRWEMFRVCQP